MGIFLHKTLRLWRRRLWIQLCLVILTGGSSPGFAADTPCEPEQVASLCLSPALTSPHPLKQTASIHSACKVRFCTLPWSLPVCKYGTASLLFLQGGNQPADGCGIQCLEISRSLWIWTSLSPRPHMLRINVCLCVESNLVWYLLRGEVGSHLPVCRAPGTPVALYK